jgi:hypothetical protein
VFSWFQSFALSNSVNLYRYGLVGAVLAPLGLDAYVVGLVHVELS